MNSKIWKSQTKSEGDRHSKRLESGGKPDVPAPSASERALVRLDRQGLTHEGVQALLVKYGYNEIIEKEVSPFVTFLTYFWGPIPWMIETAAVLSAAVRDWTDFAIIVVLLVANALVGFIEEHQAGNAIAALKKTLALRARVKRDGLWMTVAARELVPGDLIRVRLGDIVPADAHLLDGEPLQVDQSALTGESLPVTKIAGEEIFSGSVIKRGEFDALVAKTGANTFFGKTAGLVQQAQTVSHFQKAVLKIGDYLILIAIALVVLILTVALFRHDPLVTTLRFALVLTVAAIPVAMPTVLSVTMAVGARLLAAKQAIVSRLAAIEELAGMDILCSDKTGTLTQNKLTMGKPYLAHGVAESQIILAAALASRAENQDPIDLAVLGSVGKEQHLSDYKQTEFKPFDPVVKRTEATVINLSGSSLKVTKGAPQVILAMTGVKGEGLAEAEQAIDDFARRGFRSLGVAQKQVGRNWQFLGVIPLFDPPRDDSRSTLDEAKGLGVQVKMVTGDQLAIGKEIASALGLGTDILDASTFGETKQHQIGRLADVIEESDGFAQVFPEHKYHIVEVLQERGHIVGMTGDGVNDAPALKKADAGIAVAGATDAARSAADIVLLTPGLSVIVDAVRESRRIFQRMLSYATYRIAETIRVLVFMTLSILVFNFYPVTAVMIVLLALLNDGAILSIAYDRTYCSDKPEVWKMSSVLVVATVLGLIGVVSSFGLFYLGEHVLHLSRPLIQTLIYLKLSVAGHLTVFVTRTRGPFWSVPPARILFLAVIGTQLVATIFAVYGIFMTPIGWSWAGLVWAYSLAWFLVNDRIKLLTYRVFDHSEPALLATRGKG